MTIDLNNLIVNSNSAGEAHKPQSKQEYVFFKE